MTLSNDNNNDGKVVNMFSVKAQKDSPAPRTYEFHFHPTGIMDEGVYQDGQVVSATGFLKFGPQFLAVAEGLDDNATIVFAVATPVIQYIREVPAEAA